MTVPDSAPEQVQVEQVFPVMVGVRNRAIRMFIMPMATSGHTDLTHSESVKNIFITGLQNAHALEKEALQLMQRQIERFENYPEMSQILRTHIAETEGQIRRLDEILHTFGEDRSLLKDMATQFMANM